MGAADLAGAGGATAGVARGAIEIDLQSLARAQQTVMLAARQMETALMSIGAAADHSTERQVSGWQRLKNAVGQYQVSINAAFSALTGFGVQAANSLTRLQATFRLLSGSEEQAAIYMRQLEAMAQRTKIPFDDLLESAVSFIPAVRQTGAELDKVLEVATRLRLKDPTARLKDSVIAINELLSGAPRSLAARFEIPARVANELAKLAEEGKTQEALQELDAYLTSIGVTSTALDELGRSGTTAFARLSAEVRLTTAQAFQPLTNALNQIANGFADIVAGARRANYEFLQVAATVAGLVGMGSALSTIGAVAGRLPGMAGLAVIPAGVGKFGVRAGWGLASAYAGAELGAFGARQLSHIMPEQGVDLGIVRTAGKDYLKDAGLDDVLTILKQFFVIIIEQLGDVFAGLIGLFDDATEWFREALWDVTQALLSGAQKLVDLINVAIEKSGLEKLGVGKLGAIERTEPTTAEVAQALGEFRSRNQQFQTFDVDFEAFYQQVLAIWRDTGRDVGEIIKGILQPETMDRAEAFQNAIRMWFDALSLGAAKTLGVIEEKPAGLPWGLKGVPQQGATAETEFVGEAELDLFRKYQDDMTKLQEDEQEQRLQLEADYQKTLTREAEDEQVRRLRAEQTLQRNIAAIWEQLAENQAALTREYQERVAEVTEQYQKQEIKRREEYQRTLERMERQHKENLLVAASRLDASAVWQEQRRFQQSKGELQERFDQETIERRKAYEEQLAELRENHEQQLAEMRQQAERRVQQLREDFALQERLQAEDRQRRLARMRQDYEQQLRDLSAQYQRQRNLRTQQFINELSEMTTHENLKLNIAKKGYAELEAEFRAWFERQKALISGASGGVMGAIAGGAGVTTGGATTGGGAVGTPRFVTYLGKQIRVDRYDPAYSGGMSAAQWYSWTRLMGYQSGGFTGFGASTEMAGIVHKGEYVVPQRGAPVVFSDRLTRLLESVGALMTRFGLHMPVVPGRPVERRLSGGIGAVTINIHEANNPRQTAQIVRRELLAVFAELGA